MRGLGLALALVMVPAFAAATPAAPSPAISPALSPPAITRDLHALPDKLPGALNEPGRLGSVSQSATRPCPLALGLPRPNEAVIAHRIADQGNPAHPHRPCHTPNIYIRFTGEPRRPIALV